MTRLVRSYYGFQTTFSLYVWMPIFFVYQQTLGLDTQEIFGIQAHYYLAFCLFEVPTGFISDRYGHRNAMRYGSALLVASHIFALMWLSYTGMLVHWLVLAMARSLVSGAASAYLYEQLDATGHVEQYKRIEGNARAMSLVARLVAWAGVGILMNIDASLPYSISAIFALISFAIALSLGPERSRSDAAPQDTASQGIGAVLHSPRLILLMLLGVGAFVIGRVVQVNAYQPLLLHHDVDLALHGLIMSAMTLVEAIGSGRAIMLRRFIDDLSAVTTLTLGICAAMVLMMFGPIAAVAGLLIFALFTGLAYPLQKQLINDAIGPSGARATILSVESIIDRAFSGLCVLGLGHYIAAGQLRGVFFVTAGVTAVGAMGCYLAIRTLNTQLSTASGARRTSGIPRLS